MSAGTGNADSRCAAVDPVWAEEAIDDAHGEALMDDLYRDWPGEPGLDDPS